MKELLLNIHFNVYQTLTFTEKVEYSHTFSVLINKLLICSGRAKRHVAINADVHIYIFIDLPYLNAPNVSFSTRKTGSALLV